MDRYRLILGDALAVLKGLPDASVDAIVTDPPYGIGKAEWDGFFPTDWFPEALRVAKPDAPIVLLTNAGDALRDAINLLGDTYRCVFAAWLSNGMTRGPISFGNWMPCVVGTRAPKWQAIQDVIQVRINPKDRIEWHPSQKPLSVVRAVVERLTKPGDVVLDPFSGSGTTGVACVELGREYIGIDRDPTYIILSEARIGAVACQEKLPLFDGADTTRFNDVPDARTEGGGE